MRATFPGHRPCKAKSCPLSAFLVKSHSLITHCSDLYVTLLSLGDEAWSLPLPVQRCPGASAFLPSSSDLVVLKAPSASCRSCSRDSEALPLKDSKESRQLPWCLQTMATASYLITSDLSV